MSTQHSNNPSDSPEPRNRIPSLEETAVNVDADVDADADTKAMPPPRIPRPAVTSRGSAGSEREGKGERGGEERPFSPSLSGGQAGTGIAEQEGEISQTQSQNRSLAEPGVGTGTQSGSAVEASREGQREGETQIPKTENKDKDPEKEKERIPFTPFFTIVNDLSHGEQSTHHPSRVHYVFEDDDISEVFTGAVGRALEGGRWRGRLAGDEEEQVQGDVVEEEGSEEDDQAEREREREETSSGSSAPNRRDKLGSNTQAPSSRSRKPKSKSHTQVQRTSTGSSKDKGKPKTKHPGTLERERQPEEREERVLIIDISPTGDSVTKISSLSPEWQVLSAEIEKAPMWDKDGADEADQNTLPGGLMLRIEGVGLDLDGGVEDVMGTGKGKGKEREGEGSGLGSVMGEEEMHNLMEGFDRKMGILRRIVQRGSREDLGPGTLPQPPSTDVAVAHEAVPDGSVDRTGDGIGTGD